MWGKIDDQLSCCNETLLCRCAHNAMTKRDKKRPGVDVAPAKIRGNGKGKRPLRPHAKKNAVLTGNAKLIERVRQIISETPEIRPDKVNPLLEALEQGTYRIDVQKLANILIAKLFLDP